MTPAKSLPVYRFSFKVKLIMRRDNSAKPIFREVKTLKACRKLLILPLLTAAILLPSNTTEEAVKQAAAITEEKMLIPGGQAIGITLENNGILVLGTGSVTGRDRHIYHPAENILREGDVILKANGTLLEDKEALALAVEESDEVLTLSIKRENRLMDVSLSPIKSLDDGNNKIGVWVRDSTQGIGTLTYIDPADSSFGALGHGVYDTDTGELMTVKSGNVVKSNITGVKKSEKGIPGELTGMLDKTKVLGTIEKNTEQGIYGELSIDDASGFENEAIPVADINEIKVGDAEILCSLDGNESSRYNIKIESVNTKHHDADKGLVIRITDAKLKNITGGIVQGMSGSPIIQNGKLVGAVTHVLVNDPTKGYGISITDMLEAA